MEYYVYTSLDFPPVKLIRVSSKRFVLPERETQNLCL